jgi:hypothetical protein
LQTIKDSKVEHVNVNEGVQTRSMHKINCALMSNAISIGERVSYKVAQSQPQWEEDVKE